MMGDKIYFGSGFQKFEVCYSKEGLAEFLESARVKAERQQRELDPGTIEASDAHN